MPVQPAADAIDVLTFLLNRDIVSLKDTEEGFCTRFPRDIHFQTLCHLSAHLQEVPSTPPSSFGHESPGGWQFEGLFMTRRSTQYLDSRSGSLPCTFLEHCTLTPQSRETPSAHS